MIVRFQDTESNVTYLRVKEGYSYSDITDICNRDHHQESEDNEDLDELSIIEIAIRKQLMILLTDEETAEIVAYQQLHEKNKR